MSKTPTKPGLYYAKIDGKETVVLVDERMQCRHFDGSMFGTDNPVVQWLGEAVPTVDELRRPRAKQGPEEWEVTRYSFGDFGVYGSPRGWTVLNKKKHLWLSAENIWTGIIGKSKFFKTPHEAARTADRAEQR